MKPLNCMSCLRVVTVFFLSLIATPFYGVQQEPTKSANTLDVDAMKRIMIHSGGRLMPLDTYAAITLLQFSTRRHYIDSETRSKEEALPWLLRLVFEPSQVAHNEVFRIMHPEVLDALKVHENAMQDVAPKRRYSLEELSASIPLMDSFARHIALKQESNRNLVEKELMRLSYNVDIYLRLREAMSFGRPIIHAADSSTYAVIQKALGDHEDRPKTSSLSYWDLYTSGRQAAMNRLVAHYQTMDNISNLNATDWQIMAFIHDYHKIYEVGSEQSSEWRLLPVKEAHNKVRWVSPWQRLITSSDFSREGMMGLHLMHDMMQAYLNRDQASLDAAAEAFLGFQQAMLQDTDRDSSYFRSQVEVFYNALAPFQKVKLAYLLAFLSFLLTLVPFFKKRLFVLSCLRWGGMAFLIGGLVLHGMGMALRMVITERPPIVNLYGTFLFVSMITVVLGLVVERVYKKSIGVMAASLGALLLLIISAKFVQEGDTMGVLVAVLRSNFWLSTHVIAINLGYSGIIFSGLLAHAYFLMLIVTRRTDKTATSSERQLFRLVYGLQGFGLLFTFFGTVLGGIWADQSWGRFWGWDPKENGALLIILWSAILFHARMVGWVSSIGFAAGSVVNIIVVMLAWFGINLLGVGLHSYGFTSGLALGLFVYIGLQMALLMGLLYLLYTRAKAPEIS